MVRVRKLVLAIAAASALTSGMAHALGLGEVTMQSALNQPLVAEIELIEVRGLGTEDLIPNLASAEAFNRAGVDRQYFLTDLKFTPILKPNGKSVIRVTSSKPVREPYLNFLLELHWPNGRLLREYTLLLDPPLYSPQPVVSAPARLPVAAPSSTPVRSAAVAAPKKAAPAPVRAPVAAPAPVVSTPAAAPQRDGEYRTSSNDTLWDVAQRVSGGSANQAMLAIQDLNPDAFIGGNINRMKSGQVLRLPDEQQVRSRTQAEAQAQVAEQNNAWRERRNVAATSRQLDATRRTSAGAAPAQAEASDNLRLVAADSGKATSGSESGTGNSSQDLGDKLAMAQESLDTTRRENAELQARMGDLESRLDKLQRLMQLKDDQLAKLQAELGDAADQPTADAPAVTAETAPVEATAPVQASDAASAEAPAADAAAVTPGAAVEPAAEGASNAAEAQAEAAPDYNYSEEPAEEVTAADGQPVADAGQPATAPVDAPTEAVVTPQDASPQVAATPEPKPVVTPQPQEGSFLDDLLRDSTTVTVLGGGALLLLLIALMVLSRRNATREAQLHESLANQRPLEDNEINNAYTEQDAEDATEAELAEAAAQSGDVLDEADIYVAYGRFNQAAELLQAAINDEPQRSDLRLKLMEVYAELDDRDGFLREERELREIGGSHPEIEKLKSKYPAMVGLAAGALAGTAAAEELDDFDLDDLDLDAPQAAGSSSELDDAFDLSLADLEAGLETDFQASPASAQALDDEALDLNLDFDAEPSVAAQTAEEDPLADFDLDFDAPAASSLEADEAFLASLDGAPAAELELPDDFDLSLSELEAAPEQGASEDFLAELAAADAELNAFSADLESDDTLITGKVELPPEDGDDDFDFLSGTDETATKLDLARAYIDMGDSEGARDILDEVISEGSDVQQNEARELLARIV